MRKNIKRFAAVLVASAAIAAFFSGSSSAFVQDCRGCMDACAEANRECREKAKKEGTTYLLCIKSCDEQCKPNCRK